MGRWAEQERQRVENEKRRIAEETRRREEELTRRAHEELDLWMQDKPTRCRQGGYVSGNRNRRSLPPFYNATILASVHFYAQPGSGALKRVEVNLRPP